MDDRLVSDALVAAFFAGVWVVLLVVGIVVLLANCSPVGIQIVPR